MPPTEVHINPGAVEAVSISAAAVDDAIESDVADRAAGTSPRSKRSRATVLIASRNHPTSEAFAT